MAMELARARAWLVQMQSATSQPLAHVLQGCCWILSAVSHLNIYVAVLRVLYKALCLPMYRRCRTAWMTAGRS